MSYPRNDDSVKEEGVNGIQELEVNLPLENQIHRGL